MKTSFKTLLAAAVLGAAVLPLISSAQDEKPAPPPPGEGAPHPGGPGGGGGGGGGQRNGGRNMPTTEQMVARLDEAVTLTADQKTKVGEIYKKMAADMQAVPQEQRREKGMEIGKAARDQIRALLTEEQQKKFDAMPQPGRRGQGGPGGQGGQGGGRPPGGSGGEAPKKTE